LIQEDAALFSKARLSAASVVLEQYAESFHSQALARLAKAHLSEQKLSLLLRKLREVDPVTHKGGTLLHNKQGDALRLCKRIEGKEASASIHEVLLQADQAAEDLANMEANRAALSEEVEARVQLQKTIDEDMQSLSSLLQAIQRSYDASNLHDAQGQLQGQGAWGEAQLLGVAAADLDAARAELADMVSAVVQKRAHAKESQRMRLVQLEAELSGSAQMWSSRKLVAGQAQARVAAARRSSAEAEASCDAAITELLRQRHLGHMEIVAISTALEVLGGATAAQ